MTETTESLDTPAPNRRHTASGRGRARRGEGLSSMVLPDLKALAGQLGIRGTSGMRKGDLVAAIAARQNGAGASAPSKDAPAQSRGAKSTDSRGQNGAARPTSGAGRHQRPHRRAAFAARRPGRHARRTRETAPDRPTPSRPRPDTRADQGSNVRSGASRPIRAKRRSGDRPATAGRASPVGEHAGRLRGRRAQPPQPARPPGRTRIHRQRRRTEHRSEQSTTGRRQS